MPFLLPKDKVKEKVVKEIRNFLPCLIGQIGLEKGRKIECIVWWIALVDFSIKHYDDDKVASM